MRLLRNGIIKAKNEKYTASMKLNETRNLLKVFFP